MKRFPSIIIPPFSWPLRALALCALLLGRLAAPAAAEPQPTPMPTAGWRKVETQGQAATRRSLRVDLWAEEKFKETRNAERHKEIDAFAKRNWRILPGDTPEDPLRPFWKAGANVSASAVLSTGEVNEPPLFHSPRYQWFFDGTGDLLPIPDGTGETDRQQLDLTLPYSSKRLNLNMGDIPLRRLDSQPNNTRQGEDSEAALDEFLRRAQAFPKQTTVRVVASEGDPQGAAAGGGLTAAASAKGPIQGTAKVNWNLEYGVVYSVKVSLEPVVPDGEQFDINEFPDDIPADFLEDEAIKRLDVAYGNGGKNGPRLFLEVGEAVVKEVAFTVAEDLVFRGLGRGFRAIRGKKLADKISLKGLPWASRTLHAWNTTRRLNNKPRAFLRYKVRVTKKGSYGKRDPRKPRRTDDGDLEWLEPDDLEWNWDVDENGNPIPPESPTDPQPPSPEPPSDPEPPSPEPPTDPEPPTNGDPTEEQQQQQEQREQQQQQEREERERQRQREEEESNRVQEEEPVGTQTETKRDLGKSLFFYTTKADYLSDMWVSPNGNGNTKANWRNHVYYLTDLEPWRASTLTQGEHSFELFGHPYNWEGGSVKCVEIDFGHLDDQLPLFNFPMPHRDFTRMGHAMYAMDVSTFTSGKFLGAVPISFIPRTPGADDVPAGNTLPASEGRWQANGQPGNAVWESTKATVRQADEQIKGQPRSSDFVPVSFARSYPDFSPWAVQPNGLPRGRIRLPAGLQHGYSVNIANPYRGNTRYYYDVDLMEADRALARIWGWEDANREPDFWRVWNWRETHPFAPGLTWHHHEDMRTMELVPKNINNEIPHQGGRAFAKVARW